MNRQLTIELIVLKGLFAEENFEFNSAFKILTVRFTADSGLWPLTLRYYYSGDVARAGPGDDCVVITLLVADCRPLVSLGCSMSCSITHLQRRVQLYTDHKLVTDGQQKEMGRANPRKGFPLPWRIPNLKIMGMGCMVLSKLGHSLSPLIPWV